MTEEHIKLLESRTFSSISDDILQKSIHLFYTNAKAEALNNKILNDLKTRHVGLFLFALFQRQKQRIFIFILRSKT